MARVWTGGLTSLGGIIVGGDVLKSLGNASGATSLVERTTNNSTTDRASDLNNTFVSDTSYTPVTDTSVSDTSISATTSGVGQ